MAHTDCFVCLASNVSGSCKNPLEEQALVVGTKQNLSNLLFLHIYASIGHRFVDFCIDLT
jgi:hypothetical protein